MNSRGFYIALEQRILLDAAGVATAVETLPDHVDTVAAQTDFQQRESVSGLLNAFADQVSSEEQTSSSTVIFIDSRVENPEQLLGNSLDKSAEIYTIDPDVDGLAYIADILGKREGSVDSLHIISHGNSGELLLGASEVTTESLNGQTGQYLALLSDRLNDEADILFYACNVAQGEEGERFVEKFALLTGADVAASTDLTGGTALGGDADLEYSTGSIEAKTLIAAADLAAYETVLGTPDAGGNVTLSDTADAAVSITEDAADPGAANVRLTPTTLNDSGSPAPTEIRITSVSGGTLTQTNGDAIAIGAAGTKLTLVADGTPHYDFRFTPDADQDTDVTFTYVVVESGGEQNSADSTGTISISAVNDSPTGADVTLGDVDEDTASPIGTAVSTLFAGANFTDVDTGSSLGGIAVVSNSADFLTEGSWEYSTDGVNFFEIGAVGDDATALVLSASTQLRFVPATDYNGDPTGLVVRVLDNSQTSFTAGTGRITIDASSNGADTPLATATNTVGITVSPVNDAPDISEAGKFFTLTEDQAPNNGVTVANFLSGLVEDGEDDVSDIGLAITATDLSLITGTGSDWQYQLASGGGWVDVGSVSNTNALLLGPNDSIRLNPAANQVGSAELSYKVWDGSSGTAGAKENLTTGDTNRVSSTEFDSSISVTPVNDAPENLTPNAVTIDEQAAHVILATELAYTAIAGAPDEQTPEQIIYQITSTPGQGNIQKSFGGTWITLASGSLFSQKDIDDGVVRYEHTGSELSANALDSFSFNVRDGAGSVQAGSYVLTIEDVNAASTLSGTTISVNERIGTEADDVNVINIGFDDADAADPAIIVFTLKSLPVTGRLEIDFGAGFVNASISDTFTKADLNAGNVRYIHDGTEPGGLGANAGPASTTFLVDATDGNLLNPSTLVNETITLNIVPINDDPEIVANLPTVVEGGTVALTNTVIGLTDVDSESADATFVIDTIPANGALFLGGTRLGVGSLFLQEDIDNGLLSYQHFGANPDANPLTADDTFTFTARDRDGSEIPSSLGINVTPDDTDNGVTGSNVGDGDTSGDEFVVLEGGELVAADINFGRTNSGAAYVLTTEPTNGILKLDGVTLSTSDTFTAADIANGDVSYEHDDTENFTDSFVFSVDGILGNTFDIIITPVNEPPVIDIPVAGEITIAVDEHDDASTVPAGAQDISNTENAFLLTSAQLTGSDIDNQPDSALVYSLTSPPPGGSILIWDGVSYVPLIDNEFTEQDVADGLVAYFHNSNSEPNSGADKFTVELDDGGGTPSAPKTINITVTNSNDAPVTNAAAFSTSEDGTQNLATILNGKFTDSDAGDTPDNLTLIVTAVPSFGAIRNTDSSTTLGINDTFTKADLDSGFIIYDHDGTENFVDSFEYKAQDDGTPNLESAADTVSISIRPINDDPVVVVNEGIKLSDSEYENEVITITPAMLSVTDSDNTNTQVQIRITSDVTAGTLTLGGKVLGEGSVFTYADLVSGLLKYAHRDDAVLTDAFTFKVSDGGGGSEPEEVFNIQLNAVNDSPELVVPGAVSLLEETSLTITGITIDDIDAAADDLVVTLTVADGTLSFANPVLSAAVVDAGDPKAVTVTGTVAEINGMLAQGVIYTGDANFVGADALMINVNDQGSTGDDPSAIGGLANTPDSGGAGNQQADDSVAITVLPVNDAPTIDTLFGAQTVDEDTPLVLGGLAFTDIDAGGSDVSVTFSVDPNSETAGTITITETNGLVVSNNGSSTVTVTGTIAELNALAGLGGASSVSYQGGPNYNGSDVLTITINDEGNTGVGGVKIDSTTVNITIDPVNDAPVVPDVNVSGNEDAGDAGASPADGIAVPLAASSVDLVGNANSTITGFDILTLPANGSLYYTPDGGGAEDEIVGTSVDNAASLSVAEAGSLKFVPDANFNSVPGTVTFTFSATDGLLATQATATVVVNAVNDIPTLTGTAAGVSYVEADGAGAVSASVNILNADANIADVELVAEDDFDGTELQFKRQGTANGNDLFSLDSAVVSLTGGGSTEVRIGTATDPILAEITTDAAGVYIIEFNAAATEADVETIANAVQYANDADNPGTSINIEIKFADGNAGPQGSGGVGTSDGLIIAIPIDDSSNDAPIGQDVSFNSDEDAIATPSTFTLSQANVLGSEPDGDSISYVAITNNAASANALTEGIWEYSTNSGSTWSPVGVVTDSTAIVVPVNSLVRFVPVAHYNGEPGTLSFRVIDDTSADITGPSVNVSANGGITAIAAAANTLTVTINSINDAPVITATELSPTAVESAGTTGAVTLLDGSSVAVLTTDVDATHFDGGSITVSLDTYITGDVLSLAGALGVADGVVSTAGGTGGDLVITLNSNATLAQVNVLLEAIRYTHNGDNPTNSGATTTRDYSVVLNDGGQSNGPGNTGTLGTPQNSAPLNGTITLQNENDAPVGSSGSISVNEDVALPAGVLVSSLAIYADSDGDDFGGIAVTANDATAGTEGVWEYSSDAGGTWASVGSASDASSVLIQASSLIRFVPAANFTGTSADSLSVRVVDSNHVGGYSDSTAAIVTLNTSAGTPTSFFATVATPITITVNEVNDAPVFSNVGGAVAYAESAAIGGLGTPVLLDIDGEVADIELSGLDNIADNDFGGATLSLSRQGGADLADVFSLVEDNGVSLAGGNIVIGGSPIAAITSNASGILLITFAAGATDANVESVMRQIAYANNSDTPDASVIIEYTLNDKNGTDQGIGGEGVGTATVTVNITPANDAPVATNDTGSVTENSGTTTSTGNAITDATADSDADGDDLDVTDITGPNGPNVSTSGGTEFTIEGIYGTLVINKETGAYVYTLDNTRAATQLLDDGDMPTEVFNYTVSDGNGASDDANITITVVGANDVPVATVNTNSLVEDDINVMGNLITEAVADSDADGDDLDISLVTGSGLVDNGTTITVDGSYGQLIITKETGAYTYVLDNGNSTVNELGVGQSQTDVFTYTLTDGTATDTSTLTVTINGKNDAPVATVNTGSVTEDSGVTTSTGNAITDATADSDVDGDDLDVSDITGPAGAKTSVNANTEFSIEGIYGTLLINKETGAYTYTLDNSRSATQALDAGDIPTEVFNYSITDGNGGTDTSTITISVNGANDTPTTSAIISTQNSVDAEAGINVNANTLAGFADVDADDTLTFTATGLPPGLSISAAGIITGTVDSSASQGGASGVYSVVVTARDSSNALVTSSFDWNVTNPAPVATANSNAVTEDAAAPANGNLITDAVADSDSDGDDLDISSVTGASAAVDNGTTLTIQGVYGELVITKETGAYTYTLDDTLPATNSLDLADIVSENFTYTLDDNEGGTDTAVLSISITGANDAPTVTTPIPDTSTPSDAVASIDVSGNFGDVDADDTRTFGATGLPVGLTINPATGEITGTPAAGSSTGGPGSDGIFVVVVTSTDSHGALVSDTFNLTIGNAPPVATNNTNSVVADAGNIAGNVLSDGIADSDADGDDLDVSGVSFSGNPAIDNGTTLTIEGDHGTLVITKETGAYVYTPDNSNAAVKTLAPGHSLTERFTYTASDSAAQDSADLVITINGVNDAPAIDLDSNNDSGSFGADYQTIYNEGDSAVSVVDSDIVLADFDDTLLESATVTFTNLTANDVITVGALPAGITANIVGGVVTLTGSASLADYQLALQAVLFSNTSENPDTTDRNVTVVVNDGALNSNVATTTISVVAVNDPPIAQDDTYTFISTSTFNGSSVLLDNGSGADSDLDGTALSVVAAGPIATAAGGAVTILADGTFTYTPPGPNFTGTDSFDYTVTDGLLTDTATVTLLIRSANADPVAVNDTADADSGAILSGNVLINDSDGDGDPLQVTFGSGIGAGGGRFTIAADGSYEFDPQGDFDDLAAGETRQTFVTYTVSDGNGGTATATLTVTVTGANANPIAEPASLEVIAGDEPATGSLSASDPDGHAIVSFDVLSDVSAGTLTLNTDGTYSFDDNGEFDDLAEGESRTVSFTYTVTDEFGAVSEPVTVTITVSPAVVVQPTPTPPPTPEPPLIPEPPVFIDPGTGQPAPPIAGEPAVPGPSVPGGGSTPGGGGANPGVVPNINPIPTLPNPPSVDLDTDTSGSNAITQLTLTLSLQDQLVTTDGQSLFAIPANAFDNGGTSPIVVEVVQSDGSALPDFIIFNSDDLSFTVDGAAAQAAGVEEVIIRVTGSDSNGQSASGTFIIVIVEGDESEASPQEAVPVDAAPAANDGDDQASSQGAETRKHQIAAELDVSKDAVVPSFFEQLDVAANEDNFSDQVKQLLNDIKNLIS